MKPFFYSASILTFALTTGFAVFYKTGSFVLGFGAAMAGAITAGTLIALTFAGVLK